MTARQTKTITLTGPITLADLRRLVVLTEDAPEGTRVRVQAYKSHSPVDYDPDKISVTYEVDNV